MFRVQMISMIAGLVFAVGCGGGGLSSGSSQDLPEALLDSSALSNSAFTKVSLVSEVHREAWHHVGGGDQSNRPKYLIASNIVFVIPEALRGALGGWQAGAVINCPPRLYEKWPIVHDAGELLRECGPDKFDEHTQMVEYRFKNVDAANNLLGYNARMMQAQEMELQTNPFFPRPKVTSK